eukprot:jgi/Tetstr1/426480/TSEL_016781.t1
MVVNPVGVFPPHRPADRLEKSGEGAADLEEVAAGRQAGAASPQSSQPSHLVIAKTGGREAAAQEPQELAAPERTPATAAAADAVHPTGAKDLGAVPPWTSTDDLLRYTQPGGQVVAGASPNGRVDEQPTKRRSPRSLNPADDADGGHAERVLVQPLLVMTTDAHGSRQPEDVADGAHAAPDPELPSSAAHDTAPSYGCCLLCKAALVDAAQPGCPNCAKVICRTYPPEQPSQCVALVFREDGRRCERLYALEADAARGGNTWRQVTDGEFIGRGKFLVNDFLGIPMGGAWRTHAGDPLCPQAPMGHEPEPASAKDLERLARDMRWVDGNWELHAAEVAREEGAGSELSGDAASGARDEVLEAVRERLETEAEAMEEDAEEDAEEGHQEQAVPGESPSDGGAAALLLSDAALAHSPEAADASVDDATPSAGCCPLCEEQLTSTAQPGCPKCARVFCRTYPREQPSKCVALVFGDGAKRCTNLYSLVAGAASGGSTWREVMDPRFIRGGSSGGLSTFLVNDFLDIPKGKKWQVLSADPLHPKPLRKDTPEPASAKDLERLARDMRWVDGNWELHAAEAAREEGAGSEPAADAVSGARDEVLEAVRERLETEAEAMEEDAEEGHQEQAVPGESPSDEGAAAILLSDAALAHSPEAADASVDDATPSAGCCPLCEEQLTSTAQPGCPKCARVFCRTYPREQPSKCVALVFGDGARRCKRLYALAADAASGGQHLEAGDRCWELHTAEAAGEEAGRSTPTTAAEPEQRVQAEAEEGSSFEEGHGRGQWAKRRKLARKLDSESPIKAPARPERQCATRRGPSPTAATPTDARPKGSAAAPVTPSDARPKRSAAARAVAATMTQPMTTPSRARLERRVEIEPAIAQPTGSGKQTGRRKVTKQPTLNTPDNGSLIDPPTRARPERRCEPHRAADALRPQEAVRVLYHTPMRVTRRAAARLGCDGDVLLAKQPAGGGEATRYDPEVASDDATGLPSPPVLACGVRQACSRRPVGPNRSEAATVTAPPPTSEEVHAEARLPASSRDESPDGSPSVVPDSQPSSSNDAAPCELPATAYLCRTPQGRAYVRTPARSDIEAPGDEAEIEAVDATPQPPVHSEEAEEVEVGVEQMAEEHTVRRSSWLWQLAVERPAKAFNWFLGGASLASPSNRMAPASGQEISPTTQALLGRKPPTPFATKFCDKTAPAGPAGQGGGSSHPLEPSPGVVTATRHKRRQHGGADCEKRKCKRGRGAL